jgi:uncharacterized protein
MFKNKIFLFVIMAVVLATVAYTFLNDETQLSGTKPKSVGNYVKQIERERTEKDAFFKTSEESPIENKAAFKGLNYFPIDSNYNISSEILPYTEDDIETKVKLSDGTTDTYLKFGFARFNLHDTVYQLLVYQKDKTLMILFKDLTAPKETYGGGRYLDIPLGMASNGRLPIDFNRSYNPFCAYNHTYACPIPPPENTLNARIEAGEKNPN